MQHVESELCMYTVGDKNGIELAKCDADDLRFQWQIEPTREQK